MRENSNKINYLAYNGMLVDTKITAKKNENVMI